MRASLHGAVAALLAIVIGAATRPALAANACTNPGRDGPATNLSGVVNSYYPGVGSAPAGSSSITVGAVDTSMGGSSKAIAAGDLVVIMQMQDADIGSTNDATYGGSSTGSGQIALNNAGAYEYATVASTYAGGSSIPLTAPLVNGYRTAAATGGAGQRTFQVIRVPQLSSVTLAGQVTAAGWNGATGGVVILDVAGQISWNGQTIEASGRGFRGGAGLWLTGRSNQQPNYAATDYVATLAPTLPAISPTGAGPFSGADGAKGEGIAGTPRYLFLPQTVGVTVNGAGSAFDTGIEGYPNGSLARGAPGNAGGGGTDGDPAPANDQNTGGGGGGGYAGGGMGGFGWTPNTPPGSPTGGFGGQGVPMATGRMTLGGGGGAGTSNNATGTPGWGLASSGAPGGGVVLVRAKTATGSGVINANGTAGNQSVCNDASGGGGGGGAILVYASGNSGNVGTLTVNANGGAGGSNTGNGTGNNSGVCGAYNNQPHGPGGGGGGGFVGLSSVQNTTIHVNGGANGTTSPSATSTSPYGSSSSPGGFQLTAVSSTDLPGASPSSLCYPLLTVSKVTTKANTVQGGQTSYTITVANAAGHGTATGAVLTDLLPPPLTIATTDAVTLTGGSTRTLTSNPAAGSSALSWGTFSIPAGGAVSVSFTADVPAATALGTLQNSASVTYDDPTRTSAGQTVTPGGAYSTGETVLGTNYVGTSSTAEDVVVRAPAALSKGFSPVSVSAGGVAQLNVIVSNPNAAALTGAAFSDAFPAGLSAVGGAVTVTGNGCAGFGPATVAAGATSFAQSGGTVPASGTCTFSINVQVANAASYTNTMPAGAFTNGLNVINTAAASATLLSRPTIAKAFAPAAVAVSASSTLSFTVVNPNAAQALTNAAFTDTFPANLVAVGGAVTVAGTGCSGFTPTTIAANATAFSLTAGTLPAGGTCTVSFAVKSAVAGGYANTAGGVATTETVAPGAGSNTATLGVGQIAIAKAFSPAQIRSGGTATVTLTLSNPGATTQTAGAFTDTLTGMQISAAQTVGGTCAGTTPTTLAAGATNLSFTGITIPAAGCTVSFVVSSTSVGTQTNTTSGVRTALLAAGPASNTATLVVTGPPTISAAFAPATIETGGVSTLTFTIVDPDPVPLTGAAFTNVLDPALFVAGSGTVAASGTCVGASGNAFTAGAAGATLSFSGLTIPPGASGCTVTIPVSSNGASPAAGVADASSGVSSNEATTSAASNTARLVVAPPAAIAKAFGTTAIAQGGTSVITFTLTNSANVALTQAAFTDTLTNMSVAASGAAGGTCAGATSNAFSAGQTGTLSFSGLTIPAAASCTVTLAVTSNNSGANNNTASGVTSAQTPVAGAGSNTVTLTVYSPPSISLGFNPGTILSSTASPTSSSTLTITLSNANAVALTGVSFTDALSSMQIFAAGAAGGTCAGAGGNTFAAGATNLSFSGITVPASGSCTVTVKVASGSISPAAGWPDATSGASSTQTPIAGAAPSPAFLTVIGYAQIAKSFSPASIARNGTTTITFTLTNPNAVDLSNGAFSDTFPANLTTITAAQTYVGSGRGTCTTAMPSSGTGSAGSVAFSGILIPAGTSCTVMVDVTASATGNYSNTATGVTALETGTTAGPASNTATLGVGKISITKSFSPVAIAVGETTTLTFALSSTLGSNVNNNLNFTDAFPAGMSVASPLTATNTCGGTLRNAANSANLAAGGTDFSLQNGSLANGASCTVTLVVTVSAAGSYSNTTGAPKAGGTTDGPVSNTAVLAAVQKPTVAESFSPASLDTYRTSLLTLTLSNPNTGSLTSCGLTDTLSGIAVTSPPSIGGTCQGVTSSPALLPGATALNLTVANLSAGSCTITVPVTSSAAGTYSNASSGLKCNEFQTATASPAAASVTFNKLPIQVVKSASVVQAAPGTAVTYTISYANPNAQQSLQNIVITDSTPPYTSFTGAACGTLPSSLSSCTISTPAVGASGAVTWTLGGTLDPGASGSVTLTVTIK
jgi:fimbrial isopeptide formation D2 family protein